MNIVFSTRNPSKAEQIKAIFAGSFIGVLTLDEAGIEGEAIEDGSTLKENALKKALFVHESRPNIIAMADDTGLFIDHLNGEPGVKSSRWAGENATTNQILQYTLKRLKDATNRSATFETVVAIVTPDGKQHFFDGKVHGKILESPRVKPQPKMPYNAIFVPDAINLVWAEMSVELENSISHRGRAFRKALTFLKKYN